MIVKTNYSLKKHNTFGLDAMAKTWVEVTSVAEINQFLQQDALSKDLALILSGGSNLLLTKNIEGTVLHIALKGKRIISETESYALVEAAAGENWHEFVIWTIQQNLGGIENLSLIPGQCGTAPVQNIGAYGVELKDVLHSVDAIEIKTGKTHTFTAAECAFGYRESIFKNELKGAYIITHIRLKLQKPPHNTSVKYGAILEELGKKNITNPSISDVSNAVIAIRQSKLPDPNELGNSGSFFKNPVVDLQKAASLKETYPNMPQYLAPNGQTKLAAGWLIEQCGLKGFRQGDAGVHAKQALVLVNYGSATGAEIWQLAQYVMDCVQEKFGIALSPEVNVI